MKNLFQFFVVAFLFVILVIASCTKEESASELTPFEEQLRLDKLEYEAYVAEYGEVTIEYMTLKELQTLVTEYNLPPISQETIDLYNQHSTEKATGPCNSGWINYCGDLNQDGNFSSADLVVWDQTCNIVCTCDYSACSSWDLPSMYRRFGYLSYYDPDNEEEDTQTNYNKWDYDAGYKMILHLITC